MKKTYRTMPNPSKTRGDVLPPKDCAYTLLATDYKSPPRVGILTRGRTDEAKARRRIYGDVGVKFSQSKQYTVRTDGISNTLTSVLKDNLLICESS